MSDERTANENNTREAQRRQEALWCSKSNSLEEQNKALALELGNCGKRMEELRISYTRLQEELRSCKAEAAGRAREASHQAEERNVLESKLRTAQEKVG